MISARVAPIGPSNSFRWIFATLLSARGALGFFAAAAWQLSSRLGFLLRLGRPCLAPLAVFSPWARPSFWAGTPSSRAFSGATVAPVPQPRRVGGVRGFVVLHGLNLSVSGLRFSAQHDSSLCFAWKASEIFRKNMMGVSLRHTAGSRVQSDRSSEGDLQQADHNAPGWDPSTGAPLTRSGEEHVRRQDDHKPGAASPDRFRRCTSPCLDREIRSVRTCGRGR